MERWLTNPIFFLDFINFSLRFLSKDKSDSRVSKTEMFLFIHFRYSRSIEE